MDFSLYYRKPKNNELFNDLEESDLGITNLQNYVPLYEKFFSLNQYLALTRGDCQLVKFSSKRKNFATPINSL